MNNSKVKIFSSVSLDDLEFQINQYILENNIQIKDISITSTQIGLVATILYQGGKLDG